MIENIAADSKAKALEFASEVLGMIEIRVIQTERAYTGSLNLYIVKGTK